MPLDKLALILVVVLAIVWIAVMVTGVIATLPFGFPALAILAIGGYFLYRVIRDRLTSAEDDYYEKNVDK